MIDIDGSLNQVYLYSEARERSLKEINSTVALCSVGRLGVKWCSLLRHYFVVHHECGPLLGVEAPRCTVFPTCPKRILLIFIAIT